MVNCQQLIANKPAGISSVSNVRQTCREDILGKFNFNDFDVGRDIHSSPNKC